MTEAVGGAGQNAAQDILAAVSRGVSARAGAGTRKADLKTVGDDEQQQENGARESRRAYASSGEARVENGSKVARGRQHDDAKDGDDNDTSFAATIDSIDRPAQQTPPTDATQGTQQVMAWNAGLTFSQAVGQRTPTDVPALSPNADTQIRSLKLLKPESITALLAAQNRPLSGEATAAADAKSNDSADAESVTPIVIQSRETHWRFDATAIAPGSLPSAAPTDGHGATNPIALNAAGAAKGKDDTAATAASDKIKLETASAPISSAVSPADDAAPPQSFAEQQTGGQGGDASARDHPPSGGASERKVAESTTPRSIELTSSDGPSTTAGLSPATAQVRNGVLDALTGGAGDTKPSGVQAALAANLSDKPAAPAQVLHTMELTLSPADLGSVKLKLSLKSNELSIEAETSKAATAKILNDDRDSLKQNLQNAGYDVSTLKITDASASSAMGSSNSQTGGQPGNAAFQDGSQARASFAERQGGDMQRRDGAARDQGRQRSSGGNPRGSEAADTTGPGQGNAIYI